MLSHLTLFSVSNRSLFQYKQPDGTLRNHENRIAREDDLQRQLHELKEINPSSSGHGSTKGVLQRLASEASVSSFQLCKSTDVSLHRRICPGYSKLLSMQLLGWIQIPLSSLELLTLQLKRLRPGSASPQPHFSSHSSFSTPLTHLSFPIDRNRRR